MKKVNVQGFRIILSLILLTILTTSIISANSEEAPRKDFLSDLLGKLKSIGENYRGVSLSPQKAVPQRIQVCSNKYADIERLNQQADNLVEATTDRYNTINAEIKSSGCDLETIQKQLGELRTLIREAKTTKEKTQAKNQWTKFKNSNKKCIQLGNKLEKVEKEQLKNDKKIESLKIDEKEAKYASECSSIGVEQYEKYCKTWKNGKKKLGEKLIDLGYTRKQVSTLAQLRNVNKITSEEDLSKVSNALGLSEKETEIDNKEIVRALNNLELRIQRVSAKIQSFCTDGVKPDNDNLVIETGSSVLVNVGGNDYEIKLVGTESPTQATIQINGETLVVNKGNSYDNNGMTIMVRDLYHATKEGTISRIELSAKKTLEPKPTCIDGIKNGGEEGVDCGGTCNSCPIELYCGDNECTIHNENAQTCPADCSIDNIKINEGKSITREVSGTNKITLLEVKGSKEALIRVDGEKEMIVTEGNTYVVNSLSIKIVDIIKSTSKNNPSNILVTLRTTSEQLSCQDGIQNDGEVGIDCGGTCPNTCQATPICGDNTCSDGETTTTCSIDCATMATCNDGIKNGKEEGIDCGQDACLTTCTKSKIQLRYQFTCEEMHSWWDAHKKEYKINFGNSNFVCPGDVDNNGNPKPISKEAKIAAAFMLFEQLDQSEKVTELMPGRVKFTQFIKQTVTGGFNIASSGCEGSGASHSNGRIFLCPAWFNPKTHSGGQDLGKDIFPYSTLIHEVGHAYVKNSYSGNGHVECGDKSSRDGQVICDPALRDTPFAKNGGGVNFEFWFNMVLQKYFSFPNKPDTDGQRNSELITEGYLKDLFNTKNSEKTSYYFDKLS